MTLALCILFAAVAWVGAAVAVANAIKAREWLEDAAKAATQAELANEAASQNAARSSAAEHAAAAWSKAGRPTASNDCEFAEVLRKEFERRPVPADAANSDWGRTVQEGGAANG